MKFAKKCHKALAKAGKPTDPFKECSGCHKPKQKNPIAKRELQEIL